VTPHDDVPAAVGRCAVVREEDPLVARLRTLGTALDGEPSPAFREATRARLVAMAAVRSPAPPRSRLQRLLAARPGARAPRRRTRLTAGLAAAALTVTVLAALVAVSSNARPGDTLYGLKRGTEQTQLALAGDSRGQTLLGFAATRLAELSGLVRSGSAGRAGVLGTLRTMDTQTTEGTAWLTARAVAERSPARARTLEDWASGQATGLSALLPRLPDGTRTAAGRSLALLQRIDVRASALAGALGCATGPATTGADDLGPVPAACPATGGTAGGTGTGTARSSAPPPQQGTVPSVGPAAPPSGAAGSGATTPSAAPRSGTATASASAPASPTRSVPHAPEGPTPPKVPLPTLPSLPTSQPRISITLPIPVPGMHTGSSRAGTSRSASPPPGITLCLPPLLTAGC
jgi:Domain of unknown function (DUF5667)